MARRGDIVKRIRAASYFSRDQLRSELNYVDDQIGYYDSLIRDMKDATRPPNITKLMGGLSG